MGFQERHLRPLPVAVVGQWQVKRYELTLDGGELPAQVRAAADHQMEMMVAPFVPDSGSSAFSVLHHGEDAVWLNVYMWCKEAIVRCVMASAPKDDPTAFEALNEPLIGCVWELPVLCRERSAWVQHVMMNGDETAYMADRADEGPVGAP